MISIKQYKNLISTSNPFCLKKENLIVAQDSIFFVENSGCTIIYEQKIYSFQPIDNERIVFQINHGGDLIISDKGNYSTIKGKFYLSSAKIFSDELIIRGSYYTDKEKRVHAVDLKSIQVKQIDFTTIPNLKYGYDKYLNKASNNIILSHRNNSIIWQLDLGDLGSYTDEFSKQVVSGRVEELIVVDDNILVASVHRYGILGISLQTGAILWQVPNIQNVVLQERVLYSFSDFYFEIDAITGQVVRQEDYKTLFKANEFRTYWLTKPAISENLIAIASHYDNALLLLNRDSFSIGQRIELGKASNGIPLTNTPQIHLNRLYQLDGDNTLHIFEREG